MLSAQPIVALRYILQQQNTQYDNGLGVSKHVLICLSLLLAGCAQLPTQPIEEPTTSTGSVLENIQEHTDAPLTLLVFTHPHCTYCKEFEEQYLPKLTEDFVRPGFLHIERRLFPLQKYASLEIEIPEQDIALAKTLHITRVPTFFLNGEKEVGLPRWPEMRGWIDSRLQEAVQ